MGLKYDYYDGNGNAYVLRSKDIKTLEYVPIKPQYSSSGLYDGGDYLKKELSSEQYENIISVLQNAMKNKDCQIENRIKTSGVILRKEKVERISVIISPNSKELKEIETLLQETIK